MAGACPACRDAALVRKSVAMTPDSAEPQPGLCGAADGWPEPLAGLGVSAAAKLAASPLAVEAETALGVLEQLGCDSETRAAALCHMAHDLTADAGQVTEWPQDWPASLRGLMDGQQAAEQVRLLHQRRGEQGSAEGLRRLLLAMIGDLRVVFILLARQLARLRCARGQMPEDELRALATLTTDIHAPLANRLGIWQVKWELEDLAFQVLQPAVYQRISRMLAARRRDREAFIAESLRTLGQALQDAGIAAELSGRPKHIYSIWRKMQRKQLPFEQLYDIHAIRVLVNDVPACYAALGVVHGMWAHVPGEFDDYIARPKGNDYKSLHTAVAGLGGMTLEVQIRSHEMHRVSELGVAAHWRYKEDRGHDPRFDDKLAWMRRLLEPRDGGTGDDLELVAGFRTEVLEDRVYLLTPQGDVLDLPAGATVLDFAYHIHTQVGHRCRGAKVNGRIVQLTHQPRTGDSIEILTAREPDPSRDWLSVQHGFLHTGRARSKVRSWFAHADRESNLAAGQSLLDRERKRLGLTHAATAELPARLHLQSIDEVLLALAVGDINTGQLARALVHEDAVEPRPEQAPTTTGPRPPAPDAGALTIEGVGNLLTSLARCCQPLPGDTVRGFITRGRGISVHRADCKALARSRQRNPDRVIEVEWGHAPTRAYHVDVEVRGYDRRGMHKDVTALISHSGVHIVASSSRADADSGELAMTFTLRVGDFGELSTLLHRLAGLPNVLEARRVSNA